MLFFRLLFWGWLLCSWWVHPMNLPIISPVHMTAYKSAMAVLHAQYPAARGNDQELTKILTGRSDAVAQSVLAALAIAAINHFGARQAVARVITQLTATMRRVAHAPPLRSSWRRPIVILILLLLLLAGTLAAGLLDALKDLLKQLWPPPPAIPTAVTEEAVTTKTAPEPEKEDKEDHVRIAPLLCHREQAEQETHKEKKSLVRGCCDIFPNNGVDPVDAARCAPNGVLGSIKKASDWVWQRRDMAGALLDMGYKMSMIYAVLRPRRSEIIIPQKGEVGPALRSLGEVGPSRPEATPPDPARPEPVPALRSLAEKGSLEPAPLASVDDNRAFLLRAGLYVLGGVAMAGALRWYQQRAYTTASSRTVVPLPNDTPLTKAANNLSCTPAQRVHIQRACEQVCIAGRQSPKKRKKAVAQAYILGVHHAADDSEQKRDAVRKYAQACLQDLPVKKNAASPFSFSENLVY